MNIFYIIFIWRLTMKTRISVIIPIYNVQEFLEECINSVINQTINNLELNGYDRNLQIILVDDGSTDNSGIIAKKYAEEYDNIEYVYEEKQGPGHARNYGCEFVDGDYIIFLDSDDIVPPNAYELMYNSAIKNKSDMVIGNVLRFNSTHYWQSNIHKISFSGTKEVTHITESTELFYDTTSWNKLIKFSFWNKYSFKFPEKILYEDIPVTIPMHYFANNVSLIYETCYLWRYRDGISKSITQLTDDMTNLTDRLHVMNLVDDFFEKNVSQQDLFEIKNKKWLKNDLMIFINQLKIMSEIESKEYRNTLCKYIESNFRLDDFKILNGIERLKYKFLLENNFQNLIKLLNLESKNFDSLDISTKNSEIVINNEEELFGDSQFKITDYVYEGDYVNYIQKVSLGKNKILINGFVVIPGLEDTNFNNREYSFYLFNLNTHEKIPLKYTDIEIDNISSSFYFKFHDKFSYNSAGYQIQIPYSMFENDIEFMGDNIICGTFQQNNISYNFQVGIAKDTLRDSTENKVIFKRNKLFSIKYTYNKEIIINISPVEFIYDKISSDNSNFYISSENFNGDIYLQNLKDPKSNCVPLEYDPEKKVYVMDLNKMSFAKGKLIHENGDLVFHKNKRFFHFNSDYGQYAINTLNDYNYKIEKFEKSTVIESINQSDSLFNIKSKMYHVSNVPNENVNATLYIQDNKNFKRYEIANGEYLNEEGCFNFNFNLANEDINSNFYQGFHDLLIEYNIEGDIFSTPLLLLKSCNLLFSDKTHSYKLYRSNDGFLRMRVRRIRESWELKHFNRKTILNREYKFFQYLPIKQNRIFFESMWGKKYSCNPRYFYEYIDKNHPEYECVWSLIDEHIPINGNGIRVRRGSLKYFYYLATSKYFVDNVNLDDDWIKRDNQVYIQTMHGTPLKTLGLDVVTDFKSNLDKEKFIEKTYKYDFIPVQSDFVSKITKRCFLYEKTVLKLGYPRTDILFTNNNKNDILRLKKKMSLPLDKKVILYAPTWRHKNKFELMLDLESFRKNLSDEYILIFRLHHYSSSAWTPPTDNEFIYDFSDYDSVEELYLISDLLITDYSSVMFDYSILDRPILLFTYDLDEYRDKIRGLYVDIEKNNPGPLLYTSKEVEDAIVNIDKIESETKCLRKSFQEKFLHYECENSSEQIFNIMINYKKANGVFNRIKKFFKNKI